MRSGERVASGQGLIYVAGRLFSLEDKIQTERLERQLLAALADSLSTSLAAVRGRGVTYVPFRDAKQEDLVATDKTQRFFALDVERLERTALLVSNIDGLAKDEGVCFEAGYAWAAGAEILLIATDFYDVGLPSGEGLPFDPLLYFTASAIVRKPLLAVRNGSFLRRLLATRTELAVAVRRAATDLLLRPVSPRRLVRGPKVDSTVTVLCDFGGAVFEWQQLLCASIQDALRNVPGLRIQATVRYDAATAQEGAALDLRALQTADLLVTCTDADEAPSGTAFIQGAAKAIGVPIWMYNSKRTFILAPGGYRSSRNLMLDYSADRTFRSQQALIAELLALAA